MLLMKKKKKKGKIERKEAFSGCDNGGTCVASTRDFVFETFSEGINQ